MFMLISLFIAAAILVMVSYPAADGCPKGCHGCGKCMNGYPDKQKQRKG